MKKIDWFNNVENRTHPWEGMGLTWLTTALNVPDVSAAVNFYSGVMGMVPIAELPNEEGTLLFARMRYRGTNFTLNKEGWDSDLVSPQTSGQATPFIFYIYVDDAAELTRAMEIAGAEVLAEPQEMFWGDLKSRVRDPFGFIWDIAQKL
ncbi:TPA: VOC family protein [Enterobacter cancerogenus]|nr:VOC family protein [Enterobacter chengduensis]